MADDLAGRRVLVLATERIGSQMAGPAIRSANLARELARGHGAQVTLAAPSIESGTPLGDSVTGVEFGRPAARSFRRLAREHDVVLSQPQRVDVGWALHRSGTPVVHDLYVPSFTERIAHLAGEDLPRRLRERLLERDRQEYAAAVAHGAAFVCASERQRDHWLGALGQAGRLDLDLIARDPRGDALVAVVPFGASEEPASVRGAGAEPGPIRGALVPPDSVVLLWSGGLWNWFDPVTVVEALAQVRRTEPRLRLVVMGMRHPEAHWREQDASLRLRERAAELGLLDDGAVVLSEGWVPYDERGRWLADADLGVAAHHDTLETRLSFRTRFLDHLWAGLPTLTTEGGELVERMMAAGAARELPAGDVDAWSSALLELAADTQARAAMSDASRRLADELRWAQAVRPLAATLARVARGEALAAPARPSAITRARSLALLLRIRVEAKGMRSLAGAARDAAGR